MKRIQKILAASLSLMLMLAFVSVTQAGEDHKKKADTEAKKAKKAMSGVIQVEETSNGPDYFLKTRAKSQTSKTIDIKFSDKVEKELPAEGQRVSVRGYFSEEQQNQFLVTSLVIPADQQNMGQM